MGERTYPTMTKEAATATMPQCTAIKNPSTLQTAFTTMIPNCQDGFPAALITLPLKKKTDCRMPISERTCITGILGAHFLPKTAGTKSDAKIAKPMKTGKANKLVYCVTL